MASLRGQIERDARGDLSPEEFEQKGKVTEKGMAALREYLAEVPAERFSADMRVAEIGQVATISANGDTLDTPTVELTDAGAGRLAVTLHSRVIDHGVRALHLRVRQVQRGVQLERRDDVALHLQVWRQLRSLDIGVVTDRRELHVRGEPPGDSGARAGRKPSDSRLQHLQQR